jgi:hypothetical protein
MWKCLPGGGRTDILIRYQSCSYIIETKVYSDNTYFKRGKGQLAEYLKSEDISKGYYVVFINMHTDKDELFSEELIQGKRIYTHIIQTKFEPPFSSARRTETNRSGNEVAERSKIVSNMLSMEEFTTEQITGATGVSLERIKELSAISVTLRHDNKSDKMTYK